MEDRLILVDYDDHETGSMGKLEVHQKHLLHRAFRSSSSAAAVTA